MTLNDVYNHWYDLSWQKRLAALKKIVEYIEYDEADTTDLHRALLMTAIEFEEDDYFGTEGFKL